MKNRKDKKEQNVVKLKYSKINNKFMILDKCCFF